MASIGPVLNNLNKVAWCWRVGGITGTQLVPHPPFTQQLIVELNAKAGEAVAENTRLQDAVPGAAALALCSR